MNYRGSYRRLLQNGEAALLASIEIYNKPQIEYRDECFVILLLNAWELTLKALLSKNRDSIFYKKRRNEPYRTLSLTDAINRVEKHFPKTLAVLPIRLNLELLSTYRDNSVHFYNSPGFGSLIYALAQTSIVNLKDLMAESFDVDLRSRITWQLLPLGLEPPIDPIEYIAKQPKGGKSESSAIKQFLNEIAKATSELEAAKSDTARFLTVFKIKLESTKKIEKADVVVGVQKAAEGIGPLVVTRMDPNLSHPLLTNDAISNIGSLNGKTCTSGTFQAIVWKFDLKNKPEFCWRAAENRLTKYSNDIVSYIQRLSTDQVELAIKDYRNFLKAKSKARKTAS
jgi:hypothetical protein